jgi:thioredoxin reductase (NADPH)
MFFSAHARSVTILYRGETLEKSMSRYLVEQLATRANIHVEYRAEVVAAHGDASLEAIDIHNAATGETTRRESGGLFIFIGADAETSWLPPEIALDPKGYVLTGSDVRAAGRWQLDRDPFLLETSIPGILACGDVRFSPVKRVAAAVARAAWPSPSCIGTSARPETSGRRSRTPTPTTRVRTCHFGSSSDPKSGASHQR